MKDLKITPAMIREAWSAMQVGGPAPWSDRQKGSGTHRHYTSGHYTGDQVHDFVGTSGADMDDRLQNGFDPDGDLKTALNTGSADDSMPSIELHEEDGSFLLDMALMGEDTFYGQWNAEPAERGLTIRACFGASAGTNAQVLADYTNWLLKVIDAVERQGIAPSVELWIGARKCFARGDDGMTITIPLVNAGEIVDPVAWRAYLSPGAFRSLGFVALTLGADLCKRSLTGGMGYPTGQRWDVRLSGDVLEIECPPTPSDFPAAEMDAMLAALKI